MHMCITICVYVHVHVYLCEYPGAGMTWFLLQTFGGAVPPCPVSLDSRLSSVSAVAYSCAPSYRTLVEMSLGKITAYIPGSKRKGRFWTFLLSASLWFRQAPNITQHEKQALDTWLLVSWLWPHWPAAALSGPWMLGTLSERLRS